ncbi:GNAT family N-acetyltransferase [Cupriavidus sp. UYPR2.512]|uniref:GNAT family N-acetyltransferase n=1 Tax=Cupriavidus sp. UYPR2.512 TaxID=1080187 RepID=UPI001E55203F|nr:GNAT family N-acetyltransferase [Cupriavidus sp. UYPR2.512]
MPPTPPATAASAGIRRFDAIFQCISLQGLPETLGFFIRKPRLPGMDKVLFSPQHLNTPNPPTRQGPPPTGFIMIKDLRIRSAGTQDLPAVSKVLAQCGLDEHEIEAHLDAFHVAELEGRVVGCAGAERYDDLIVIRSVAVLPEFRQLGVATHLVSAVLMRARAQGVRRAVLATGNCPSHFARYGFELCSAETLPAEVRASHTLKIAGIPPGLCMHCELK